MNTPSPLDIAAARSAIRDVLNANTRATDALRIISPQNHDRPRVNPARAILSLMTESLSGEDREAAQENAREFGASFDPQRPYFRFDDLIDVRSLTYNSLSGGGYLSSATVGTPVDILRPWSVSARAGITVLDRLAAPLNIPRSTATVTATSINGESTTVTPSTPTVGQASLAAKEAGIVLEMSRLFLLQASSAPQFANRELLRTMGSFIDKQILQGSGVNGDATGIFNTSGIDTRAGTSLSHANTLSMQQKIAEANATDENIRWIATPAVRTVLAGRERATGSGFIWDRDQVTSRPAFVSTLVPTAGFVGTDWSLVVLALWGPGFQIELNPYANFQAGIVQLRILLSYDAGVLFPSAVSAATAVT
jgi:HK97 family phage major capsid protein